MWSFLRILTGTRISPRNTSWARFSLFHTSTLQTEIKGEISWLCIYEFIVSNYFTSCLAHTTITLWISHKHKPHSSSLTRDIIKKNRSLSGAYLLRAEKPTQYQCNDTTSSPNLKTMHGCLPFIMPTLTSESTVMEASNILNQKTRLSISSQNTPDLNSLYPPQTKEKYSVLLSTSEGKQGCSVWIKHNSLDLKLFYVLLLHMEITGRFFRVAAWPCDLRTNMSALTNRVLYT